MSHKKAKRIRKLLRMSDFDPEQARYERDRRFGPIVLAPNCGKRAVREMKKLAAKRPQ